MNEQDLMIQEKIKKREKTDIMIAYAMIVILVICILIVVYLKFIRKDDSISNNDDTTEYTVNYVSMGTIANDINNNLKDSYNGINANASDKSININYGDLLYDIKLNNNEIEFKVDNDNRELSEAIYKEMIASICTYYSNDRTGCVNASNDITGNTDGVRFAGDNIYISITNSISPLNNNDKELYTEETITEIDNTNYELLLNDIGINNINIDMGNIDISITGNISDNGKVVVKLYDNDNNLLESKDVDSADNKFSINFTYNDKLVKDNIKKYSINIE